MVRALSITFLLLGSALASADAAAQDCMCVVPDVSEGPTRTLESIEVGPFFSSDGTMLSSRLLERRLAYEAGFPRLPRDIPWCAGGYDPRCGSAPPLPDGPRNWFSGTHAAALTDALVPPWPPEIEATPWIAREDGPRAGVASRVERPPKT